MDQAMNIREGMPVYGADGQVIGTVQRLHDGGIHVNGQHLLGSAIARVAQSGVYLSETGAMSLGGATAGQASQQTAGEVRIPVGEERLNVEKRETELGALQVRKTVTQEEQTVPVELRREEVRVEERDISDRPVNPNEAFREETLEIPLRGEEAVVQKEAVVTGEVVIGKEQTVEQQQVTETVRRQQVELDEGSRQAATSAGTSEARRAYTTPVGQEVRVGIEVVASDGTRIGQVKEVRSNDLLVDRRMARDIYVPFSAVADIGGDRVTLNLPADEVSAKDWTKPALLG